MLPISNFAPRPAFSHRRSARQRREHDRVVLTAPIPDQGLEQGDVGAVVQVYPWAAAYEVEFVTLGGKRRRSGHHSHWESSDGDEDRAPPCAGVVVALNRQPHPADAALRHPRIEHEPGKDEVGKVTTGEMAIPEDPAH